MADFRIVELAVVAEIDPGDDSSIHRGSCGLP